MAVPAIERLKGRPAAVVAALAVALGAVFAARQDWPRYRLLQKEGAVAEGWVTAKGLGDSRDVNYSFWVGPRLYSGVGRPGFGTPDFDSLSVDDHVLVYYLPRDPDVSTLGEPKEQLRPQNRAIALALMVAVPFLLLAVWRELKGHA